MDEEKLTRVLEFVSENILFLDVFEEVSDYTTEELQKYDYIIISHDDSLYRIKKEI